MKATLQTPSSCKQRICFQERTLRIMKKLPFLLLSLLLCLCSTAFAASLPGQQSISYITDVNGYVNTLTDDDTTTAWTKSANSAVDLTINLYRGTVGEIWIRNGYAYTQNWYNNYDRASKVKVTVYYAANQYTTSYDTYRYTLSDSYRPNTVSATWNSGYQRLLLPKQYSGVTKIELTVESSITGYGRTGATISDIIITSGSFATATPKSYATATPRPFVVYVTPTPGPIIEEDDYPYVEVIKPNPPKAEEEDEEEDEDDNPYVEFITPRPKLTPTPLVQLITPTPKPLKYPSEGGAIGYATQRIYTRYGPTTGYGGAGTYFSEGHEVKVITKVWDDINKGYWYQIEFLYEDEWYRAYTPEARVDVDQQLIPDEPQMNDPLDARKSLIAAPIYYGPGENYKQLGTLGKGKLCPIYNIENGWVQVEYINYADEVKYRGWVPLSVMYGD